MGYARAAGVPAPELLYEGSIRDGYIFRYIIMTCVPGRAAEAVLPTFTPGQKRRFAEELKRAVTKLHAAAYDWRIPTVSAHNARVDWRWDVFPETMRLDVAACAAKLGGCRLVLTHGDLTGKNVIIGEDGRLSLIDFADSRAAPEFYEWPQIIFALLDEDPAALRAFFGDYQNDAFMEKLTAGVMLHQFGGDIAGRACETLRVPPDAIRDEGDLRALLAQKLQGGKA